MSTIYSYNRKKYIKKDVNINISINNNCHHEDNEKINRLESKINHIENNMNNLTNELNNKTSLSTFQNNLSKFFNEEQREKIVSLINGNNVNILLDYIDNFNKFDNIKHVPVFEEIIIETINELPEIINENNHEVYAKINNKLVLINDEPDFDKDPITLFRIPVEGFVLGMEIYTSKSLNITENFITKISYNNEIDTSTIFLSKEDYKHIHGMEPNNKIKVHVLKDFHNGEKKGGN